MMPDGSDIIPLSFHDTNEWHPSVDNNGMIIYTRWDYIDRDSDIAHHIWHCFPDGRDPRSYHGNYPINREDRPWMEMANRAIPNSHRYIGVSAQHHGQNYGSLVMIDIREKDDGACSQVKRITPEVRFGESEDAPGVPGRGKRGGARGAQIYGQPWPLDEDFYICTYSPDGRKLHGIYLVDSFGNKELLYQDDKIACLDPMPLRPRKRPPIIPTQTQQAEVDRKEPLDQLGMGLVNVMNVYEAEYPFPEGTKIKELRVINLFPKPNHNAGEPMIGRADQSLARGILGTVPVEEDGSAYFECPVNALIYFQALDENGFMVQNMRSATYLHPGETLSCVGCHESKFNPPPRITNTPLAQKRAPSKLKIEAAGSFPLTFPRMVQPILDAKCVKCHEKEKHAPSLRGDKFGTRGWSEGFWTLQKYAWGKSGGNGAIKKNGRSYSLPGQEGFRASKLYQHLVKNEHLKKKDKNVKLTPQELRTIAAWVDCNSNFYGAYLETEKQAKGGLVKPLLGLPQLVPFEKLQK